MINPNELAINSCNNGNCDSCSKSVPESELKGAMTSAGVEGSFCHECRHGKTCDCPPDSEPNTIVECDVCDSRETLGGEVSERTLEDAGWYLGDISILCPDHAAPDSTDSNRATAMKQLLQKNTGRQDKVQCADCWQWIKRDENHTCKQQVRRNRQAETGANRLRPSQKIVTVCDKCLTESCWQGRFMCEEARTAGTITDTEENIARLKPSELEQAAENSWR